MVGTLTFVTYVPIVAFALGITAGDRRKDIVKGRIRADR